MIDYTNEVIDTPAIGSDLNQQPAFQPSPYVGGMNPISTVSSFEPSPQLPQAQMLKLSLLGRIDPLTNAILTKHAQEVKKGTDAKLLFTKANTAGQTPAEVTDDAVNNLFQINQENAMLSGAIGKINNQIEKLRKEQELARQLKANRVPQVADATRYYDSIDELAKMQASAPTAPAMQTPELNQVDQALVFLAGLVGGVEQMPDVIQGAVAGATKRAQLANQIANQKFDAEQQNYARKVQAQQTIVNKEATRLGQQEKIFADQYNRQREEDQDTIDLAQKEITKLLGESRTYEASVLAGLQKQYLDGKKNAIEFNAQDNQNIDTLRQAAIQAGVPPLVAQGIFKYVVPGERTIKGTQIKMDEDYAIQRELASYRDYDLKQLKAINDIAKSIIESLQFTEITEEMAITKNREIAKFASDRGIPRYMLPVVVAGKSTQLMNAEENRRHNIVMEGIAKRNADIAQARLDLERTRPKDKNEENKWLNSLRETKQELLGKLQGQKNIVDSGVGGQAVRDATNEVLNLEGQIKAIDGVLLAPSAKGVSNASTGAGTGTSKGQGMSEKEKADLQAEASKKKDKDKNNPNAGGSNPKAGGGNPKAKSNEPLKTAGGRVLIK